MRHRELPYPLTKANRIRLARAFSGCRRVDLGIDCAIEGQMGTAAADHPDHPTAFKIEQGPFCYFAGNENSPGAREMVQAISPYTLIMPTFAEWTRLAKEIHRELLVPVNRHSFSTESLAIEHLDFLLDQSAHRGAIQRLDATLVIQAANSPNAFLDIACFDSAADFQDRGVGYCLLQDDQVIAAAYSSLVCSKGIEVSIFVFKEHRKKGIATALGCCLLKHCLENNIDPHWDAANEESCRLGHKLGYTPQGSYVAYLFAK